jgi:hypothetical protein
MSDKARISCLKKSQSTITTFILSSTRDQTKDRKISNDGDRRKTIWHHHINHESNKNQ